MDIVKGSIQAQAQLFKKCAAPAQCEPIGLPPAYVGISGPGHGVRSQGSEVLNRVVGKIMKKTGIE
jgi:hypothetical protein